MEIVILSGILIGLDNLLVAAGVGSLDIKPAHKWRIAFMFGFFEAVMPLIGLILGGMLSEPLGEAAQLVGPLTLVVAGLLTLYGGVRESKTSRLVARSSSFVLPLALSFDNLFAGVALGTLGYPPLVSSLIAGGISAVMCFIGLAIGQSVRHNVPRFSRIPMEYVTGIYFIGLAAFVFLTGA